MFYWRLPQPYPCLEILKEDSQDSAHHCKHGYDVDTSAGRKGSRAKVQRKPGTSFPDLLPVESHRICLIAPASNFETHVKSHLFGELIRDSKPKILTGGWSCRPSLPSTSQDSSLPAGRQVFGHTVHTVRAQEPLLTICGQFYISVGKCSPFKFPDEGEGPALQTDLSKQSSLRAAMLSLS